MGLDVNDAPSPGPVAFKSSLSEALFASPLEALITIDEENAIVAFNPGAERIFGHTEKEMLGKPLEGLMPESFRAGHSMHIAAFRADPALARTMGERRPIYGLRRNSEEFRAEASLHKHSKDGKTYLTVIMRDMGDSRFRGAFEAMSVGICECDPASMRFLRVNQAFADMMGYGRDELVGRSFDDVVHPDDHEECRAVAAALMRGEIEEYRSERRHVRKDNSTFWVELTVNLVRDSNGAPLHAIATVLDVTPRVEARDALSALNRGLEQRVAERTHDLEREMRRREEAQAALAAAQRLDSLGRLTGGVAHDTNNMLTIIGGNLELIEDALGDNASALRFLREAQSGVDKLSQLNRRLLTFARQRRLESVAVDPVAHIGGLEEMLHRVLGAGIELELSLPQRCGEILVDPVELDNAILNLAFNARDAMTKGGLLHISMHEATIDADAARSEVDLNPGEYVVISLTDTGEGMAPEVLAQAFEPFFTTKPQGKGTGLGLATIYGFVKQSGGHITIYSEAGRGTTVNLYLRRASQNGAAGAMKSTRNATPLGAGELVLVVEDDPQVRALTCERLRRLGYGVLEASNAERALEMLKVSPDIRLIFSDVVMGPGASGFELADQIETQWPGRPVLLTSGFDMGAERDGDARFAGRVLQKPYNQATLAQALRDALQTSKT